MKNSSIRSKPDMPVGHSRRDVLALAAVLPLACLIGAPAKAEAGESGGIIIRDGWILRADDLNRLGIA